MTDNRSPDNWSPEDITEATEWLVDQLRLEHANALMALAVVDAPEIATAIERVDVAEAERVTETLGHLFVELDEMIRKGVETVSRIIGTMTRCDAVCVSCPPRVTNL